MQNSRPLIRYTALDTVLLIAETDRLRLGWSRGLSLTTRILAVNMFALALMAGGLFFLDSYRARLISERQEFAETQLASLRDTLPLIAEGQRNRLLMQYAERGPLRIRIYAADGTRSFDSFAIAKPTYDLVDPEKEPLRKTLARWMDKVFDFLVASPDLGRFSEPTADRASAWSVLNALSANKTQSRVQLADDLTHIIVAGSRSADGRDYLLTTANPRDLRALVRAERFSIGMFILLVLGISVLLSLFLARTIVRPLQHLARAAVKVRLGRAPEVHVPRLPERRDEIGMLARALSDMSIALRQRIDATEAFAADVAHEIKNPLASLRSALDGLDTVKKPEHRDQLMDVAKDDVQRMDRLISDISDASRIDAQLAKAKFEQIDLGDMIDQLLAARESRNADGAITIAFARPRRGIALIMGEDLRLERVLTNLLDNAVSFSPESGLVEVSATRSGDDVIIRIMDQGPGIPPQEREAVFRRFHSERPSSENFGSHSGLGLAIARTIIEGHHGSITVHDREDQQRGACFQIMLPAAGSIQP
jgi:two-component system, OmpR family, sensor histidine kinase ChvG